MSRLHSADLFLNEKGEVVLILPKSADRDLLEAVINGVQRQHWYETTDGRHAFVLTDPKNSVTLEPTENGADLIMRITSLF